MNENKTNINWYPGHMAKTKRFIKEKLDQIDLVLEVVDARIPYSSRIPDLNEIVKEKPRLLILTKYDLCDPTVTKKWIEKYEEDGYQVITTDLNHDEHITKKIMEKAKELCKIQEEKRLKKGLRLRKIRALVVGVPNVGKSTLINRLVGKKAVSVGNRPGITKTLDWIRISEDLELLDSPGILWPKIENEIVALNLASFTAIKEDILPLDEVACHILSMLSKYYPEQLKDRYGITSFDPNQVEDSFLQIGKKRGALIRGGEVDYDKVITFIMNDMKQGFIKGITFDHIETFFS